MKKIDLHIHTISSALDPPFEFSSDKLLDYVFEANLDAIGITNQSLRVLELHQNLLTSRRSMILDGLKQTYKARAVG